MRRSACNRLCFLLIILILLFSDVVLLDVFLGAVYIGTISKSSSGNSNVHSSGSDGSSK